MKIDKKMYLSFLFYISGTFLVVIMFGIVLTNFFRDARIFAKPVMVAVEQPANQDDVQPELAGDSSFKGTLVYRAAQQQQQKKSVSPTVDPEKTPEVKTAEITLPAATPTHTPERSSTKPAATATNNNPTTGNGTEDVNDGRVKIEIINYTGDEKIAQDVKDTLESAGYKVSLRDENIVMSVGTLIIERNEKADGTEVQNILKVGKVQSEYGIQSQFDITIILGNDIIP